ncbi:MAG: cache domain-containing protein, partial [Bryobacteraceae bacterium]|nr:cache domain-containing protein [Bryobacteraceae bacterium]
MGFRSEAFSTVMRFSLRAGILIVPVLIGAFLVYMAAAEQEHLHHANLRWLAQMAAQIHDKVQNYSNLVRDRAEPSSSLSGTANDSAPYSIESLKPAGTPCNPEKWVQLSVLDSAQERQLRFAHSKGDRHVCAYSDLKQLVGPTLRSGIFTSIVLAERNGRVLYRSGPDTLQITNVSFLFASEASRQNRPGSKAGASEPPRAEPPTASTHTHGLIGDTRYAIFVQPVPLALRSGADAKDTEWLLIGLSENNSLLPATSPNDMMLLLPFALALAALTWPLHKLWTMAPTDPLRSRDIAAIVLCSFGVFLVLSMLYVSEYLRQASAMRMDRQLNSFSKAFGENLQSELRLAVQQLYELDSIAAAKAVQTTEVATEILANRLEAKQVFLLFDYVDWIDGQGEKKVRWTTRSVAPQAVNVADRSYFRDVLAGNTFTLGSLPARPFAIEQVMSRTTGQAVTVVGIPSAVREHKVASLVVNLVSITDPVIPRDLGYSIIDSTGKVLFHSDRSRVFVENLFEECRQS